MASTPPLDGVEQILELLHVVLFLEVTHLAKRRFGFSQYVCIGHALDSCRIEALRYIQVGQLVEAYGTVVELEA